MAQQAFRTHDDKRLAQRPDHLPPKHVKHLCGGGWNAHLDIVFGAELQKTLQPCGGVLGPLPFIAVRQHHHQAA